MAKTAAHRFCGQLSILDGKVIPLKRRFNFVKAMLLKTN